MTPDPTQTSDAELLAWIIASIAVEKGDVKGHEFHGNQWTEGMGSEKVAAIQNRLAKAADKLTKKAFGKIAEGYVDWSTTLERGGYKTLEEYQKASAQAIKDYVAKGDIVVSVVTPEKNLLSILNSGEIQNGYVSGQSQWFSGKYGNLRAKFENNAFGLTSKSPSTERPVYGFVDSPGLIDDNQVQQYGEVKILLNPDIKERSTVTLGDSFAHALWADQREAWFNTATAPILASNPNPSDIFYPPTGTKADIPTALSNPIENLYPDYYYVEAQIHGGLQTSDIARVDFYDKPSPEVEAALKEKNIHYRTNIKD